MILPRDLIRLYREERIIPFVGAGASMGVTWNDGGHDKRGISWTEFVNQAVAGLGVSRPELLRARGSDLQILEYYLATKHNFMELNNWMLLTMTPPEDALQRSSLHAALASLVKCDLFYTTNFDFILERALTLHGRSVHVTAAVHHMGKKPACEVVKFHGDLNNPDHMVVSESNYERRLALEDPMDFRLKSDLLNKAALFIGYSFRDWNVSYLFRTLNDTFGKLKDTEHGRRAFILVPDPSDFELRLYGARNIEVIPLSSSDITASTASIIEQIARS